MLDDAEVMQAASISAAGRPGTLTVHADPTNPRHHQRLPLRNGTTGTVLTHPPGLPGSPFPGQRAPAWPEHGPDQGLRVKAVQDHPDRLLVRHPIPAGQRIERHPQPRQILLLSMLEPCSRQAQSRSMLRGAAVTRPSTGLDQ
jgi:hypothetical protein